MAIWGSIIGGMLGFSIGGPFGMLLGSLIGGKMSRARSSGDLDLLHSHNKYLHSL